MNPFPVARLWLLTWCALVGSPVPVLASPHVLEADICIYGGTSAGIMAAVQSARLGKTAVLLEPSLHLGGLTTGGLGATDIGNKAAIGGLSREFYHRIALHYAQDAAWHRESRSAYFARNPGGQAGASLLSGTQATMWTFEPRVAENIFWSFVNEHRLPVYLGQPLLSVTQDAARLSTLRTPSLVVRARMFIDATYEGDLLAAAGVSFTIGREANTRYGETLNGIRPETPHHQFTLPVDPYLTPGAPQSGLLPFIQPGDGGTPGEGDHRLQAYNYRLCFTTDPGNRLPLTRPPDYNPEDYELLARYLEARIAAGQTPTFGEFWAPIWMPNRKTDINNRGGFSTDFIGMNYDYPTADPATRRRMQREHEMYIRGFLTFLATSPRVPESLRREAQAWGPAADEFVDTGGWPNQLYVREARRMRGEVVMTEHHCRGSQVIEDSIGLAAYNMDSHNCQRIVKHGFVENEGDVQVPPMSPYPISYRAIVPRQDECPNLLVPVCLSASHIAYGSIRMEPVFMILGQSAATAAAQAIEAGQTVQHVAYEPLQQRLIEDGQVLAWNP